MGSTGEPRPAEHPAKASAPDPSSPAGLEEQRLELARTLARAEKRLARREAALRRDLAKIDEAEGWVARASWLVPLASRAPRGAKELVVRDWSTGTEASWVFPLDPAKGAREQVDAVFRSARRLRRGRPVAEKRLDEACTLQSLLQDLSAEVAAAATEEELAALRARANEVAPRDLPRAAAEGTRGRARKRAPYRTFVGSSGLSILVGRGAKQNDELTLHVARPHHVWLHAKGDSGAHVVALVEKGRELLPEQLLDAAHLAAHFSGARGETIVDVSWTARRYVRKPRKSPPGLVVVDREHVLGLRIEASRLERLLASEIEDLADCAPTRNPRK